MINTTHTTINNYIDALAERAELAGDGRLELAMGYFHDLLLSLKLQSYELEMLSKATANIHKIVAEMKNS